MQKAQRFVAVCLLGALLFNYPFLALFNRLRISKQNRITSLADFIASRYGKSALLGGVVTIADSDPCPRRNTA